MNIADLPSSKASIDCEGLGESHPGARQIVDPSKYKLSKVGSLVKEVHSTGTHPGLCGMNRPILIC